MKIVLIFYIVLIMSGCRDTNTTQPLSNETWNVTDYFPLSSGNSWTYDLHRNSTAYGDTVIVWTVSIDSTFTIDSVEWHHVVNGCIQFFPGSGVESPPNVLCGSLAIFGGNLITMRPDVSDPRILRQVTILNEPLLIGKDWIDWSVDTTVNFEGGLFDRRIEKIKRGIQNLELVRVQAGTFVALHLQDSTMGVREWKTGLGTFWDSTSLVSNEWYVSGIGMVKRTVAGARRRSDGRFGALTNMESQLRSYSVLDKE